MQVPRCAENLPDRYRALKIVQMGANAEFASFAGHSAVAKLLRQHDWAQSSLDPPERWPQSLRSVVELMMGSAFPMFVAWGPQLHTLYNDAYAEIMGARHPQGLTRPILEIWSEIRVELAPLLERALGGEAFFVENMPLRVRRNGFDEDTWFTFSYSPVRDDEGRIAGIYCACTETTRMVLAERRLRAREEWLHSLFDNAPGFTAVVRGPAHVFQMANRAYFEITGNRDLLGKPVADALPEVVEQGFVNSLDDAFRSGEPFVGRAMPVFLFQTPGQPAYQAFIDFVFQPLFGPAGQVEGIFIQGHDVTEQQRAQEALRDADRQKDEFLAMLAHELRNPLAPIHTAVCLLASPAADEALRVRATQIIGRQAGQMARLLDDLIDISRITQRRLLLRKELIEVGPLVEAALESARPLADAKGHELIASVADPAALLLADPVRIAQVLSNLLNNAAKYTDPGGRIAIEVRPEGEVMRFVVTDNGIGIRQSALQGLFTLFTQENAALDRSEGGLGIGLALVKALVESHAGSVTASSAGPGHGSRFVVELPLAAADVDGDADADAQAAPELAFDSSGASGNNPDAVDTDPVHVFSAGLVAAPAGRSVLLADDNRDACEVLAELLRLSGHEVHTAHDGARATELALQHQPDVLVLDIGMPCKNGYEVAQQIRAQPWGARAFLIAATGWSQEDDRQMANSAGFDVHLTKPFDPLVLMDLIAQQPPR